MIRYILIYILFICTTGLLGQVGINTKNPITIFHIDGAGDNDNGYPNANQAVNDFVVTKNGDVGVGTITPQNKIEINSGVTNESGLRFTQFNSNTHQLEDAVGLGLDNLGNVIVSPSIANIGDIKYSVRSSDHFGWYLLDGRLVSSLPSEVEKKAISIGFTTNLINQSDKVLKSKSLSEEILDESGSNYFTISQKNFPSFSFSDSLKITTETAGSHAHKSSVGGYFFATNTQMGNDGSGNFVGTQGPLASWDGMGITVYLASSGLHKHEISSSSTTAIIPGQNEAVDNRQKYLVINMFVYLGN